MLDQMVYVSPNFVISKINRQFLGSSYHAVEYNQTTGKVIRRRTAQGYANNSRGPGDKLGGSMGLHLVKFRTKLWGQLY